MTMLEHIHLSIKCIDRKPMTFSLMPKGVEHEQLRSTEDSTPPVGYGPKTYRRYHTE